MTTVSLYTSELDNRRAKVNQYRMPFECRSRLLTKVNFVGICI